MRGLLAPVGVPLAVGRHRLFGFRGSSIVDSSANFTVAPGTAPTMSSWVQAIAATTKDADIIDLWIGTIGGSGVNSASLVDIGFGPAGSEVAVVSNLLGYGTQGFTAISSQKRVTIPMHVPAGTRIAVRATCATAGRTGADFRVITRTAHHRAPSALVALTTAPNGTTCIGSVTATSANTYSEVTAACPQPLSGVIVTTGVNGTTTATGATDTLTVGVGAAGAEVTFGTLPYIVNNAEVVFAPESTIYGNIPAGARIAVKKATASNTLDFHLLGVPYA